jgi:hypothetical protein
MAAGAVSLVVAPDAATRVAAAGEWVAALAPDADALVVAPTWEACDDLAREAILASGGRVGLVRLTLDRLAVRLAARALARRGLVPPSGLSVAAVVARAVHRLAGDGELGRFAPVARHPRQPPALGRTIEELRLAGIGTAKLDALLPGGPDLARVAAAVERELAADGLADRAVVLETARAAVAIG